MTQTAIMIDIETFGKRPGCDIRSIGACVMDLDVGVFDTRGGITADQHFYIACDNPLMGTYSEDHFSQAELDMIDGPHRRYTLTRDPDTVQWWSEQSPEAQAAFAGAVDLREALERLSDWLSTYTWANYPTPTIVPIYAHGPQFDLSILEAAYHAVGLPVPWHYRAPRDTRTLMDAAQVGDHSAWLESYSTGTAHHALSDAIGQARAMCAAWAVLTGRKRDADRYAWLRDGNGYAPEEAMVHGGEALDRLCDEEREAPIASANTPGTRTAFEMGYISARESLTLDEGWKRFMGNRI